MKSNDGRNLSGLQQYLDVLQQKNIEIKKPQNLAEDYFRDNIRLPFLSRLLENVQKRFPHTTVLAAFDIFNPRKMPSDDNLLLEYGNEEVVTLAEQFKGVVLG